ncbi:MAG: hypothetical protein ACXQTV_02770 [Candidatus Hecatellaceae archaeon]
MASVINEAILTIAVIVAASIFAAALTSGFQNLSDAQKKTLSKLSEEFETRIEIIFADSQSGGFKVWVKNVGCRSIPQALIGEGSDLILQKVGETSLRIPYNAAQPPTWTYTILNDGDADGDWDPHETLEISVQLGENPAEGDWLIEFTVYTGYGDQYTISL